MLDQCWASVVDGGPTLIQHWANSSFIQLSIYSGSEQTVHTLIRVRSGHPPYFASVNMLSVKEELPIICVIIDE